MTQRLYYNSSELVDFESQVEEVIAASAAQPRVGIVLRETAFYPTSGGQVFDTGWLNLAASAASAARVAEVVETEDGRIVHYLEAPAPSLAPGTVVRGSVDAERRRDHMQQHSGQHVLSAAFLALYNVPTVSFHMGEDYCSIDLTAETLTAQQVTAAEKRANEIVLENRLVNVRFVSREEATKLGLRKLPPAERDQLRLIEMADFDLSACGGTHVNATGQIGAILLRKTEKVRQGTRVEFVCGLRAVRAARRDYAVLTDAAALYSTQLQDVPEMIRKGFEEAKLLRKQRDEALDALAGSMAQAAVRERIESNGRVVVTHLFTDRDINFAKLFAQKVVRAGPPAVALVASTVNPPGVVFAQTPGVTADMGALLKEALSAAGGRGGGSRDFAQGGIPAGADAKQLLEKAAGTIKA